MPPLRTMRKPLSMAWPLPDISSKTSTPSPFVRSKIVRDQIRIGRREHLIGTELFREFEFCGIDVDRVDGGRAGCARDRNRHQPDRSHAGNDDRFHADARGHDRVHGIPERIENRGKLVGNRRIELPNVRFGHGDVVGERAVAIDADNLHFFADVRFAGAAQQARLVGDVPFGGYPIARLRPCARQDRLPQPCP